jgi:hypothetical protein
VRESYCHNLKHMFMKLHFLIAICIVLLAGCQPNYYRAIHRDTSIIAIITVEYRSENTMYQTVLQLLKMARVMELKTDLNTGFERTEARYENLPEYKAAQIEDMLRQTAGVTEVTVKWETGVIKNVVRPVMYSRTPEL